MTRAYSITRHCIVVITEKLILFDGFYPFIPLKSVSWNPEMRPNQTKSNENTIESDRIRSDTIRYDPTRSNVTPRNINLYSLVKTIAMFLFLFYRFLFAFIHFRSIQLIVYLKQFDVSGS